MINAAEVPNAVSPGRANRGRRIPRFGLKLLFLLITALSLCVAGLTQAGVRRAEFEVVSNELTRDQDGLIGGELHCRYLGPESDEPRAFRFEIRGVQSSTLMDLRTGQKDVVRFRFKRVGPLGRQDPFKRYIVRDLGIPADAIVGYVMTDVQTNVMINGGGSAELEPGS